MNKPALFVFCLLWLAGCATTTPSRLSTPSGRPEVTISGVTTKQVIDRVVARALSKGNTIKRVNDYEVVMGKTVSDSILVSLFYGSRYDYNPEARTIINVVQVKDAVKVYARAEMVTNPGSAFERISDVTEQASSRLQESLEGVLHDLAPVQASPVPTQVSPKPTVEQQVSAQQASASTPQYESTETSGDSSVFAFEAEKMAINSGCRTASGARPHASLIQKDSTFYLYDVKCIDRQMMVKCEDGSCKLFK